MKYRDHRGGLAESMQTVVELNTEDEFMVHMLKRTGPKGGGISFTHQGYDNRIGWDTYNVLLDGQAIGMTDGPPTFLAGAGIKFEYGEPDANS